MLSNSDESPQAETQRWVITYTDLMTLMLTFFVLLLSMSVQDEERSRKALSSLVGSFGFMPGGRAADGDPEGMDVREPRAPMLPREPIDYEMLKEVTARNSLDAEIQVLQENGRLVLQINERVLFVAGTTNLSPEIQSYLAALASHLEASNDPIEIRGHTDPHEQLDNPRWTSTSWQLSAERAHAVMDYLSRRRIAANRLSAHGFSYYHPLVDTLEFPDQRYRNRRVEIVLGNDAVIPSSLTERRRKPNPYMFYKDFLFRLTPMDL